jgi:ABC-type phosphate transport system substrate-binding protein
MMKWRRLVGLVCLMVLLVPALAGATGYVVIAHKDLEVESLSKAELQAIFLGEKVRWPNRKHVKIALLEGGALLREFLGDVVGKTPAQYDTHWSRLVFTGKASMPPYLPDSGAVAQFVAGKPGAIGFVAAGQPVAGVKVITIR